MSSANTIDKLQKVFIRQVVLVLSLNALVKPIYLLGIERSVQNRVGTESYGIFFILFNFIYLFQVLNDLGIQQYNNRFIAQNRQLLGKYFPKILSLKISLTGLFMLVASICGFIFGYVQQYPWLFCIIMLNHAINTLFLYLRTNISGLGLYSHDSILSALDKLLLIFICLGLFYITGEDFNIFHFAIGQTVSLVLASTWALWLLRKHISFKKNPIKASEARVLIKQMLPFGLVLLLGTIYTRIDAVMIDFLRDDGLYQSGMYAAAYRLLNAFNMVGFLIAGLLLPMFSRALRQMSPLHGTIRSGSAFLGWMSITIAVIFYFYGRELSDLIYTDSSAEWGDTLSILMLTIIPQAIDYLYGTLLVANGKLKFLNGVFAFTVLVNICLNLWLIPHQGAYGAALATGISQGIVACAFAWKCHKNLIKKGIITYWGRIITLGIVLIIITMLLRYWGLNFIIAIIVLGLTSCVLVILLGIVRVKDIVELASFSDRE